MKLVLTLACLAAAAVAALLVFGLPGISCDLPTREALAAPAAPAPVRSREILSQVYLVDQKHRSMKGPYSQQTFALGEGEEPELLWITGYRAVMVGADGETPMPQEFMCHSNLDLDPALHNERFDSRNPISGRLFTLSQGQLEIDLPDGFGLPVMSDEALELTTQVLNLNHEEIKVDVRHKVLVDYVRDREAGDAMRPLMPLAVYGLASLEGQPMTFDREGAEDHGASCLVRPNAAVHEYEDSLGRRFTGHWVVPPGREENRTLVTKILDLPFDTTVHYIAVHLHPFAESLELRDLTTGESVFRSRVRPADEGIGIEHVEYFSSAQGLPLFKGHEYELVSVYENTSGEEQDSMAVMYMYLLDRRFERPAA